MRINQLPILFAGLAIMTAEVEARLPASTPDATAEKFFGKFDPSFFNGGVLVSRLARPVTVRVEGYAGFATKTPLRRESVFQLASAAKPFTSTAVLQLRDRGRLKLDDPVARHLSGFPYPAITVRHLLTHTSGLPDLELFEPLIAAQPTHIVSGTDLIPALVGWQKPVRFKAGAQFRYSNVNYQLLAQLVATITYRPFGVYVRDHILRPAGMRSSFVLGTPPITQTGMPIGNHVLAVMFRTEPEDVRRLDYSDKVMMRPYRYEGFNLGSTVGDQNLFSTLADLERFDQALRSGRILSKKSQEEAYAPVRLNDGSDYSEPAIYDLYASRCSYGMGWEICRHPNRGRLVGHAGYNRGIAVMLYRELDGGLMAAMYDNADTVDFAKKFASVINIAHGEAPLAVSRQRSAAREYGRALIDEGPVSALILFGRLRADPDHWTVTKGGLNRLGYDLLRNGYAALALEPFRINLLLHPDDAGVLDSYGEVLAANSRAKEAILAYRRSLELKPDNETAKAALKSLEKAN